MTAKIITSNQIEVKNELAKGEKRIRDPKRPNFFTIEPDPTRKTYTSHDLNIDPPKPKENVEKKEVISITSHELPSTEKEIQIQNEALRKKTNKKKGSKK